MAPRRLAGAVCLRPRPTQCSVVAFVFRQRAEPSAHAAASDGYVIRSAATKRAPISQSAANRSITTPHRIAKACPETATSTAVVPPTPDAMRNRAAGARLAAGQRPGRFPGAEEQNGEREGQADSQRNEEEHHRCCPNEPADRQQRRDRRSVRERARSRPQPASDPVAKDPPLRGQSR